MQISLAPTLGFVAAISGVTARVPKHKDDGSSSTVYSATSTRVYSSSRTGKDGKTTVTSASSSSLTRTTTTVVVISTSTTTVSGSSLIQGTTTMGSATTTTPVCILLPPVQSPFANDRWTGRLRYPYCQFWIRVYVYGPMEATIS